MLFIGEFINKAGVLFEVYELLDEPGLLSQQDIIIFTRPLTAIAAR